MKLINFNACFLGRAIARIGPFQLVSRDLHIFKVGTIKLDRAIMETVPTQKIK